MRRTVSSGLNYGSIVKCKKETGNMHTKFGEGYNIKKVNRLDKELSREDIMRIYNAKIKGKKVFALDSKGNQKEYISKIEASRKLKIDRLTLNKRIKDGKLWNGYTFKEE